jgi:hypothetical protein
LHIFFIDKVDGPIQALVRERKRYLFRRVHRTLAENRQIRGDQMHEEKVRLPVKSEETERNPSAEHPIAAREHNKDD